MEREKITEIAFKVTLHYCISELTNFGFFFPYKILSRIPKMETRNGPK